MPRSQMLSHPACPLQIHGSLQTNTIRVNHSSLLGLRLLGLLRLGHVLHYQGRRHGAVQTARQQAAHGPLAHQPLAHRQFKQGAHLRARADFQIRIRIVRRICAKVIHVRHISRLVQPKARVIRLQLGFKLWFVAGSNFRRRHEAPTRKLFHVSAVLQRLHFARNRDVALVVAGSANVERPHAKRVARNVNEVSVSVNEHQRKYTVQLTQRGLHVAVEQAVQVNDHFAVRPADVSVREPMFLNELPMIVNLAVANQLAAQQ